MITFIIGISILIFGYIFYSKYVEKIIKPTDDLTPANKINDGVDFVPISKQRNCFIHLLNIAGMGPILGAIQGILFGPIAFILIPLGAVFMGGVHDYFSGILSMRNNGSQITGIIEKYLGKNAFKIFTIIVSIMLLLLASVFVYTSGDIFAERFFNIKDFSLSNPIIIITYSVIILYFMMATLFPVDKIIGKFYPYLGGLLIVGTALVLIGFFTKGVHLQNIDFNLINQHPLKLAIIPMFFMTVSCGLLSGFHSTQATIISRTVENEHDAKAIFYGMMILESLIAMIWAAGAMDIYSTHSIAPNLIGTANVVNTIADKFVSPYLAFIVTLAVVVLPITSGDTALRGLRLTIAQTLNIEQKKIVNRFMISIPLLCLLILILYWAKLHAESFSMIWRYFTFFNQLIATPMLACATIYLYRAKKNFYITLIPCLFYVFITSCFILNSKIGFNLSLDFSKIIALILTIFGLIFIIKTSKKSNEV